MIGHSQGGFGSVGMLPQHANMFFFPYNSETKVLQRLDDLASLGRQRGTSSLKFDSSFSDERLKDGRVHFQDLRPKGLDVKPNG